MSEKINCKQQKTTPLSKTKTQLPMSVNRIPHTPANHINVNVRINFFSNISISYYTFLKSNILILAQ